MLTQPLSCCTAALKCWNAWLHSTRIKMNTKLVWFLVISHASVALGLYNCARSFLCKIDYWYSNREGRVISKLKLVSKLNGKIKTEEPILTFNIVNTILIKELVTSNEGSLNGRWSAANLSIKDVENFGTVLTFLCQKSGCSLSVNFRHVFQHAELRFDSENTDVCWKMTGCEKGE